MKDAEKYGNERKGEGGESVSGKKGCRYSKGIGKQEDIGEWRKKRMRKGKGNNKEKQGRMDGQLQERR